MDVLYIFDRIKLHVLQLVLDDLHESSIDYKSDLIMSMMKKVSIFGGSGVSPLISAKSSFSMLRRLLLTISLGKSQSRSCSQFRNHNFTAEEITKKLTISMQERPETNKMLRAEYFN